MTEFELYLMLPKSAEQTRQIILGENSYHGNDFMFPVSDFKKKNHEIWKLNQKKWLNNGKNVKIRMEYSIQEIVSVQLRQSQARLA